jgi:hypothetical protein
MLQTLVGAMTLAALGQNYAMAQGLQTYGPKNQAITPEIIEIRAGMFDTYAVDRSQTRFSDRTRGTVIAESNPDGSISWESSDREKLGGHNAPELIYVQMFDGVFAIDPFQPLPVANDSAAQILFRGTTLETDRTQHGRQQIDRTKELFRKLEQTRINWLRDNGFYGVRVITNDNPWSEDTQASALPEPSAVFERPADVPRGKSKEQVKRNDRQDDQGVKMAGVVSMMKTTDQPIRISVPHTMGAEVLARVEKLNMQSQEQRDADEVAIKE